MADFDYDCEDSHIQHRLKHLFFEAVATFVSKIARPDTQSACPKCNKGEVHDKKECIYFAPCFVKYQFDYCLNLVSTHLIYQKFCDLIDDDPLVTHKMVLYSFIGLSDTKEPVARLREDADFRQEFFDYFQMREENEGEIPSPTNSNDSDVTLVLDDNEETYRAGPSHLYKWDDLPE